MDKLLVNQGDLARHFKLTGPRVKEMIDSLGVKPVVGGTHKLYKWSDIVKALGGEEDSPVMQAKIEKAKKPAKVSVGGIWLNKPDSDRLDVLCAEMNCKRSDIVKAGLFEYMEKLEDAPVAPRVNGHAHA